jgi:hypothetical protein
MRHNNIQTIGRAALKNHHQPLAARPRIGNSPCGARQEARQRSRANGRERSVTKKNATSDLHKNSS